MLNYCTATAFITIYNSALHPEELSPKTEAELNRLIEQHRLPSTYREQLLEFVVPLAQSIFKQARKEAPFLLGVQGSQGSGKSTLAEFLSVIFASEYGLKTEICSIDDFYLSHADRQTLADKLHPLLATRGVPGTHDVEKMRSAFHSFKHRTPFTIPRFNKAVDDLHPESQWTKVTETPDLLIFEGWCVGIQAQPVNQLTKPINSLEADEDSQGHWRRYVNQQLAADYAAIFALLDALVVIQAPSFECVYQWRAEQEAKLVASLEKRGLPTSKTLSGSELSRFIEHYQRLTQHGLETLPLIADFVLKLNTMHEFIELTDNSVASESDS